MLQESESKQHQPEAKKEEGETREEMKIDSVTEPIRQANRIEDPLALLPEFGRLEAGEHKFRLETRKRARLDDAVFDWCFRLLEGNMRAIYEKSKSGWSEAEKREEMDDAKAYYLVAYDESDGRPVGFCHFRFDMDFDNEVIYCYELQLDPAIRKNGLGKFMMEFLEALCEKLELEKVMLTCSKHNKIGQAFFRKKMGYELDETDMNDEDPELDYDILSKVFWEEASDNADDANADE